MAQVILDELNLAPQSVLEGLNSCLDHRAAVYIPELNATFQCPPSFRVFGCQNPLQQGGGRKGLPKSFLNRFTQARRIRARENCMRARDDCMRAHEDCMRRERACGLHAWSMRRLYHDLRLSWPMRRHNYSN